MTPSYTEMSNSCGSQSMRLPFKKYSALLFPLVWTNTLTANAQQNLLQMHPVTMALGMHYFNIMVMQTDPKLSNAVPEASLRLKAGMPPLNWNALPFNGPCPNVTITCKECQISLSSQTTNHLWAFFSKNLEDIVNSCLKWFREKLMPYTFDMQWTKGKNNLIADALSRAPVFSPSPEDHHYCKTILPRKSLQNFNLF